MTGLTAREAIEILGLVPLEGEGGYFRRTWVSPIEAGPAPDSTSGAAGRAAESRAAGSAIYFLLTAEPDGFSAFHRLGTDEVYHFYRGDPAELHLLKPDGSHELVILGPNFERGQNPQALVRAGVVQGSRLVAGGAWALLGCTMAPAFAPEDFQLLERAELGSRYPGLSTLVSELTRE